MSKLEKILLVLILILTIALGFNLYLNHQKTGNATVDQSAPTIATEEAKINTKTEIVYVPKLVYADGTKEKTDVELNSGKPSVTVKVNGKEQAFNLIQGETQKFEDGKVVMNQDSTIKFDIKTEQTPQIKCGAYVSEDTNNKGEIGVRASLQTKKYDIDLTANQKKEARLMYTWWLK